MDAIVVSVTDAARAIGLSRSKIYELIQSGDITIVKIGRRTLIPITSIKALIERSSVEGAK